MKEYQSPYKEPGNDKPALQSLPLKPYRVAISQLLLYSKEKERPHILRLLTWKHIGNETDSLMKAND